MNAGKDAKGGKSMWFDEAAFPSLGAGAHGARRRLRADGQSFLSADRLSAGWPEAPSDLWTNCLLSSRAVWESKRESEPGGAGLPPSQIVFVLHFALNPATRLGGGEPWPRKRDPCGSSHTR